MIAALVPVKRLADSKSRMLPELDAAARETLALAMLRDVLAALTAAQRVARTAVVTPDDEVASVARSAGAEVVLFREPGLNPALEAGARALDLGPDDALLVLLGDVAGALPADLDALCAEIERLPSPAGVLAPSTDGGSAALLRRPADAFPACFGPDSAARHEEAAARAGVPLVRRPLPSLALDLDDVEDLRRFLATTGGGRHTRAVLAAFDREIRA